LNNPTARAQEKPESSLSVLRLILLVIVPFGSGYFLSYFLRNVNAVLAPVITSEFSLTATDIGLLTSLYFLAAAMVVIPVAIALDRYGPRKVMLVQMSVTASGCLLFAIADSTVLLMIARGLIGLGVAGCLTSAFKAVTVWFPQTRWATGNSMVLGVGSLGVIAGTQPLQWLLLHLSWRDLFWLACAVCVTLFFVLLLLVPERNAPAAKAAITSSTIYRSVLRLPIFWRIMPAASLSMAFFFAVQGLWANAWMSDVAALNQTEIGARLLVMAIAMSAGMLINGTVGDLLNNVGIPLAIVIAIGIGLFIVAMFVLVLGVQPRAWWPWAVIGFTGNIGALGYPIITREFPTYASARVVSVLAVSNFILAFIIQFTLGSLLDIWGQDAAGVYPQIAYRWSFALMLALVTIAFIWFLGSRETWSTVQTRFNLSPSSDSTANPIQHANIRGRDSDAMS